MSTQLQSRYRTHTCGELRGSHADSHVILSGWLARKRDHGGVVFVDLRDNYGSTQIVFSAEQRDEIQKIRVESVVCIEGKVVVRPKDLINTKLPTGEVEVQCEKLTILSEADILPFQVAEDDNAPENLRLTYRFLELRREKLHQNILLRSRVIQELRNIMHGLGFHEFQTPILTSSSPEGARDFLVPSRLHPGKFFALPQAPQQFKQLLMIAGFDRYFQIAPCFRDEDARADRSPGEFYQLDMEMSFVEQEDVFRVGEEIFTKLFQGLSSWPIGQTPFPRIRYKDAMETYGTDKPDLRNSLKISDYSSLFASTEFRVFRSVLDSSGFIRGILVPVEKIPARKYFDDLVEDFSKQSGQGLAYLSFENGEMKGSIAKFVSETEKAALIQQANAQGPSILLLAAGSNKQILPHLGRLRTKLGGDWNRIDSQRWELCWITDMPFYEEDEKTGLIDFGHNPFSMPQGGLEALLTKNPLEIPAYQYDIVCNGYELSSGAIRNHLPEIMYKAFEIVGYSEEEVNNRFGGMIRAFKFGAPPHGGMAPGIDRIVMLLAEESAIREVIAFPLTQSGEDLLMGAPSEVRPKQLEEAHIQIKLPPELKNA